MTADEHRAGLFALTRLVVPTPRGEAFEEWRAENRARQLHYMLEVAGLDAFDPATKYLEQAVEVQDAFELADLCVLLERVAAAG